MWLLTALSLSLVFPTIIASSFRVNNLQHDILDRKRAENNILARQDTPSTSTTSTLGILPNAGTGTPSLGGHSLTGHGPAVQPQPYDSNASAGNDSSNGTDTTTTPSSNSTDINTNTTNSQPTHLEVTNYQYTFNGRPRVDITLKYGTNNITQTWEVRNDTLAQVPSNGSTPCGTPPTMGTGTSSVDSGGGESSASGNGTEGAGTGGVESSTSSALPPSTVITMSSGAYGGSSGTGTPAPPRQARPDAARPGFTGP